MSLERLGKGQEGRERTQIADGANLLICAESALASPSGDCNWARTRTPRYLTLRETISGEAKCKSPKFNFDFAGDADLNHLQCSPLSSTAPSFINSNFVS